MPNATDETRAGERGVNAFEVLAILSGEGTYDLGHIPRVVLSRFGWALSSFDLDVTKMLRWIAGRLIVDLIRAGRNVGQINVVDARGIASFFEELRDDADDEVRTSLLQLDLPHRQARITLGPIVHWQNSFSVFFDRRSESYTATLLDELPIACLRGQPTGDARVSDGRQRQGDDKREGNKGVT